MPVNPTFIPAVAIAARRRRIVRKVEEAGADQPDTARTLTELGVHDTHLASRLARSGVLVPADGNRYFLSFYGAFLFLILRGLSIALEASTLFSRLLAGAVTMIFFTYAFVNMGMVSGILPVVGVPLPFISYGGTAMVTLGMGLGILMSIAKSKRLVQT